MDFRTYLESEIKKRFTEKAFDVWWKKNADSAIEWVNNNTETALELGANDEDTSKHQAIDLAYKLGLADFEKIIKANTTTKNQKKLKEFSVENKRIVNRINNFLQMYKLKFKLPSGTDYYQFTYDMQSLKKGKQVINLEGYNSKTQTSVTVPKNLVQPVMNALKEYFTKYYNLSYNENKITFPD